MSKHIAIYTDDPDKGGVAQYNHEIACGLVRAGYRVSVIQSESHGWRVKAQEALSVQHVWIPYDTGKEFTRTITDTTDAERVFAALKPDLVIFSDCCPVSNIAGKQTALRLGIPYLITVNFVAAYLVERFKNCLPVVTKQYAAAAEVIAVSTENLQLLRQLFGLGADKGTLIFYGVAERYFLPPDHARRNETRRVNGLSQDSVVSFTAARLTPVKGHILQIHAMDLIRKQLPDLKLVAVWAGEGELRGALEEEIGKRALQDRFRLIGQQSDMVPWYEAADMFTLTSSSEGMPIAIMEAMGQGLPVAATAVSGIPEELGGEGALLANPEKDAAQTVMQLARAWVTWARDQKTRRQAGEHLRARADALFRVETMVTATICQVQKAINNPATSPSLS